MLTVIVPLLVVSAAYLVRKCSVRKRDDRRSEKEKLQAWRDALSRSDLVQFRLLTGRIVDDGEVVMIEKGRRRVLVSSESDQKAWIAMDSIYPPAYVFE